MTVLVTGSNGFIGYYLTQQLIQKNYTVVATGKGECRLPFQNKNFVYENMDFTDPFAVHDVFMKYRPEAVVHAGALSNVDACEMNQWECYLTNVEGTLTLLFNSAACQSHFIFISTDFIFDGERGMYKEDDTPNPVNFYGKTKQEAEDAVREYAFDWAIARTILVYGQSYAAKKNILTIIKEKLEKNEAYKVVDDQYRTPTYVDDLAAGIVSIIRKKATGIYHLSGKDMLTPYQMACMAADQLGFDKSLIIKVTERNFSQPARRPRKTGFTIEKARHELGYEPISFQEGLKKTFS
jgi:dTDP-4-dehydrorhamnose reductase